MKKPSILSGTTLRYKTAIGIIAVVLGLFRFFISAAKAVDLVVLRSFAEFISDYVIEGTGLESLHSLRVFIALAKIYEPASLVIAFLIFTFGIVLLCANPGVPADKPRLKARMASKGLMWLCLVHIAVELTYWLFVNNIKDFVGEAGVAEVTASLALVRPAFALDALASFAVIATCFLGLAEAWRRSDGDYTGTIEPPVHFNNLNTLNDFEHFDNNRHEGPRIIMPIGGKAEAQLEHEILSGGDERKKKKLQDLNTLYNDGIINEKQYTAQRRRLLES